MKMQMDIRAYQRCEDGDCNSCPRWKKCVKEYLDHLMALIKKRKK